MDKTKARENFDRLKEEHAKAIEVTKERVKKWKQFKSDYESLQARLCTLPDKVTYDIMVPFGKFAFMPGQLYHTNELLVLLGDNWFVERSARDAAAIAERRKQQVIKLLEEEEKQLADWEMRLEFTSDLEGPLKEQGGMVEIREEYTGQGEQGKTRREHTSDPAKRKAHPPLRVSFDPSKAATKTQIDEGLWKRLNELEKEEEEGGKEEVMESGKEEVVESGKEEVVEGGKEVMEGGKEEVVEGGKEEVMEGGKEEVVEGGKEVMEGGKEEVMEGGKEGGQEAKGAVHTKSVEAVVVATQGTPTTAEKSSPVSATTTLNAADIGDSCPEQHQPTPLRLLFSHSSSQSIDQPLSRTAEHEHMATSADSSGESCKAVFSSPADIFRSKSKASESVVEKEEKNEDKTSARKSVSWDATLAKAESHRHGHRIEPAVHQAPMAFSGQVVERVASSTSEPATDPTRKVSRFKASRQK